MNNFILGFERFVKACNKVLTIISNTALVILVLVVALQIFGRYIFNVYFVWTEETSRYLMFWVVMLGAAKALQVDAHPRVTFVVEGLFKGRGTHSCKIFSTVASIVFYLILIIFGWQFSMMNFDQLSLSLRIPMTLIFIAMPIGGFFLLINSLIEILKEVKNIKEHSLKVGVEMAGTDQ